MKLDNAHNLINQTHKQALKQKLLMEYAAVHVEQAQRSNNPNKSNILKIMVQKLHWKLSIPIISTGLVAVTVFTLYYPHSQQQQVSFLQSVQAAYAKEAEQMNNSDLVHHTKVLTKQISGGGADGEDRETVTDVTMEKWDSKDKSTLLTTDNNTNTETSHLVTVFDPVKNTSLAPSDNMPIATYDLPDNVPTVVSESNCSDCEKFITVCTTGPQDANKVMSAGLAMNDISSLPEAERGNKIQELINKQQVEDLGEKDGRHGFKINEESYIEEFYFDSSSFKLKKHVINQTVVEEYVVDEYISKDQVDPQIWDTSKLKQVPTDTTPAQQQIINDILNNKPAGCYNEKGEKVQDVQVSQDGMSSETITVDNTNTVQLGNVNMIDGEALIVKPETREFIMQSR